MEITDNSNTSINTSSHCSPSASLNAKMRRMKIQEDLLIQIIKKTMPVSYGENENSFIKFDLEFKKYLSHLKKTYGDIKRLFDDIKCTTKSQDILQTLDIDDIKKDVLDLDNKIKSYKNFLQGELYELKQTEKELLQQLNEDTKQNIRLKKSPKVPTKSYSDIVPSPVKNLIKSPLKSTEVQEFQDFITSSSKYGGWNEYNHNIFIRIWHKHFPYKEDCIEPEKIPEIETDAFIDEVIDKIPGRYNGVRRMKIFSHIKWYSKYLYLKNRQKTALEEWRAKTKPNKIQQRSRPNTSYIECTKLSNVRNKRKITKSNQAEHDMTLSKMDYPTDGTVYTPPLSEDQFYNCIEVNEFLKEIDHIHYGKGPRSSSEFGFAKPTKQWTYRCNSDSDLKFYNKNIEDISKLKIPPWRQGLKDE